MNLLRFAVIAATVACGTQSKGGVDSECQDEHCAVSHLQLQTALEPPPAVESFFALAPGELQHCQQPPPEEDYYKPITEVLYEHPGEDAWCILSKAKGFNFSLACAMARKHKYIRGYVEYDYQRVQFEAKTFPVGFGEAFHLETQKEVVLPSGSSLMVRDYTDIWCAINGYYNISRAAALNDYEYLTHVSGNLCALAKQRVPDYSSLSLNDMLLPVVPHMNYINKLLMSDKPVVHLNQTDMDIMHTTAGVQCRMDNDHGGNCDVAYCAYRGCLDADGMTVKHTDKGECPLV